jgi:hypothetical protein
MSAPSAPTPKPEPRKMLVIGDAAATTITMEDLWAEEKRRHKKSGGRI